MFQPGWQVQSGLGRSASAKGDVGQAGGGCRVTRCLTAECSEGRGYRGQLIHSINILDQVLGLFGGQSEAQLSIVV